MYVGLYKLDFPKETRLLYCGNRGRILYASLYAHAAFMNGITPTCTLYLGLYKNLLSKRDPPFVFRQSPWCAPSESLCRLCMYMYVCMYVCIYLSIYLSIYDPVPVEKYVHVTNYTNYSDLEIFIGVCRFFVDLHVSIYQSFYLSTCNFIFTYIELHVSIYLSLPWCNSSLIHMWLAMCLWSP